MMNNRIIPLPLLLFFLSMVAIPLAAQETDKGAALLWEDTGFTAEKLSETGDFLRWKITTAEGFSFFYSGPSLPGGNILYRLTEMIEVIQKFGHISLESATVLQQSERLEMVLQTESVLWQNRDYQSYLPSGLFFYSEGRLEYSFRMLVNDYLLRLQGGFFSEESLLDKLQSAASDPEKFVRSQNPEYFARVLGEIDAEVQTTQKQIASLMAENQEIQEKLEATEEALELAKNDLETRTRLLADQQEKVLTAVHVLNNRGFFNSLKEYNKPAVTRILDLKEGNPELSQEEVSQKLKEEGIQASGKEIFLVFALFFNEFE